ncbi:MAG: PH domain-containing protein [Microgenomates group bacterium]
MADIYSAKEKVVGNLSMGAIHKLIEKTGSDNLLTSYVTLPNRICFETQDDQEQVILFLRQHPIVNLKWIIIVALMISLPSIFSFFPPYAGLPVNYQFVITAGWYMFVFGYALAKFMGWFFNIYILTDERVVDVDFQNIFFRRISTAKIEEIQDVNIQSSGAFETFFGYGSLFIQTAAEVSQFEFLYVPRPDKVGKIINQLIDLEEQEKIDGRVK